MAIIEAAAWNAIWGLLKDPALLVRLGRAYYESMGKPEGDSWSASGSASLRRSPQRAT
jgi:hypothetical protein